MRRSLSLKQKIWLSYFFIFTIPFLILGGMVYYNAVISLQHEIERTNIRQLELVRDEIDKLMQEMNTLTTHLSMDPELTPFMVGRNGYAQLESVRELARYRSYNPHLEDILLYYYGNEELYSTLGTMSIDTLANEFYRFPDRDIAMWLEQSDILLDSEFIQAVNLKVKGRNSDLIAYVSPIPQNSFIHYGKVVLLLNGESLTNQIRNLLGDLRGSIFVLDESKRVMAYENSGLPITESMLSKVWQENWTPGIRQIDWNSKSYSLAFVDSERTGWSFVTLMPTEQFLSRVISMKIIVFFVLAILICVGVLGTLVISRRQYQPIGRLFQNALNILPRPSEQQTGNELDYIGNTLHTTYRSNLELIERVDLQKEIMKEKFLHQWLQGKLSDEQVEEGISTHHLHLQGNCYFVLIVDLENGPSGLLSAEHKEEVSRTLNHFVFDGGEAYGAKQDWETEMVLLVALEQEYEDTKRMRNKIAMELQQRVASRIEARLTVSVGQVYAQPKLINRSFIEASGAMEYRIREGSGGVIFFEDIQDGNYDDIWYPIEDQIRFIQSLKQGDAGVAAETLRMIMESIAHRGQSLLMLRLICSDLINSVFKLMREMRIVDSTDKIRDIAEFTSLSELEVLLGQLVEDICDHVVQKRESNNTRLQNEVIALIQSRYQSLDFSLEQLAVHFRLSSSYLSRFIKEQTGMTFTDYVQQLRHEEAKRLLVETDLPVKEIVGLVGYIGVSKYIEKFRKQEGITPGEYRKLYRKSQEG
ncbi:helix-turn-helix domain-containing protein [Paenibacillus koleovorans]|uniref:helix-turn-helix domain-containing protein n=1 Tax=Paenibacillus koleovorans TaxID=121608 RepID=UPI000FD973F7|nr:helix-turn-helix domain-containing protein [Paenibacillus koleovorans]